MASDAVMAAMDSIRVVPNHDINRIHSSRIAGKLHKGHNITAASASIPSKYQTVVTDNTDRKGFLAKSKRFQHDMEVDDHPGPGNYVSHAGMDKFSPSYSKKGTGGFASKDRRIQKFQVVHSPGSNTYFLPSMLTTKKDFNRAATTSVFHHPIAELTSKQATVPGPNQYNVVQVNTGKTNNVSANSAFKSMSKREMINISESSDKPAPWQYHVKDTITRDSVKVPFSSFKSTSDRKMAPDSLQNPGPGTYKPWEPVTPAKRTVFPRKHYLCISAPAMPLPQPPPSPGPGNYDIINYDGPLKHFMSSSVFVSNTSRWGGDGNMAAPDIPGPAHYRPLPFGKQSFIYNATGRWI